MQTKIVLVGYPLEGNLQMRSKEILAICILIQRAKYIPMAPQIVAIADQCNTAQNIRKIVFDSIQQCLCNQSVDEMWMYGSMVSRDMIAFIRMAHRYSIPVVPKSDILRRIMYHRD